MSWLHVTLSHEMVNTQKAQRLTYLDTGNFDHEHCRSKYMPGIVAPKFDPSDLRLLVKVDRLNAVHACLNVLLCVQHLVCGNVAHFDIVGQQPAGHNIDEVRLHDIVTTNNYKYSASTQVKYFTKCYKLHKVGIRE